MMTLEQALHFVADSSPAQSGAENLLCHLVAQIYEKETSEVVESVRGLRRVAWLGTKLEKTQRELDQVKAVLARITKEEVK